MNERNFSRLCPPFKNFHSQVILHLKEFNSLIIIFLHPLVTEQAILQQKKTPFEKIEWCLR